MNGDDPANVRANQLGVVQINQCSMSAVRLLQSNLNVMLYTIIMFQIDILATQMSCLRVAKHVTSNIMDTYSNGT